MTIRLLHVIRSLNPESGGPAEGVRQLVSATARLHHETEVVTLDAADNPWADRFGCRVHCLGPARLNYGYSPRYYQWLRGHCRRFSAVIVNGLWQYHSYATWRALRGERTAPYYVFPHGMLDPWFKQRYPVRHAKKLLYWPWAEYRVLRDSAAVLFTSEQEQLLARRTFPGYRAREAVVNHGVPAPAGDPAVQRALFLHRFPRLLGRRVLLYMGRIHPKKGCDLLIEAFAAAARGDQRLHLVIAGPDNAGFKPSLMALAARLAIDPCITWTGMLSDDIKAGAFRCAEAMVLPSHQENFGIAVAEALSYGLPVLVSNQVNIWREIAADQAGLVADDTLAGTTEMLKKWFRLGAVERRTMGTNALGCFTRRFHIDAAAANILAIVGRQHDDVQRGRAA